MRNVFVAVLFTLSFSFTTAGAADMAMQDPAAKPAVEIHSQGIIKAWDERRYPSLTRPFLRLVGRQ